MIVSSSLIVFPEGDTQEIPHTLKINQLTDVNGYPLPLPLSTQKMIVFRVFRISTRDLPGETQRLFYLELVGMPELLEYT